MKPNTYIRCPRCELNYILKKDKFCNVCKSEMHAGGEVLDFELDFDICPICKSNYISGDETMCETCAKERASEAPLDDGEEWKNYLDESEEQPEEETDSLTISDFDEVDDDEDFVIPVEEEIDEDLDSADDDDLEDEEDLDLDDLDLDDDDDYKFSDDDDFGDDE